MGEADGEQDKLDDRLWGSDDDDEEADDDDNKVCLVTMGYQHHGVHPRKFLFLGGFYEFIVQFH